MLRLAPVALRGAGGRLPDSSSRQQSELSLGFLGFGGLGVRVWGFRVGGLGVRG